MPRARSTNKTNRSNESAPSISLPDSLKACLDGWVEKDTSNTGILLMSESAFEALYLRDCIKNSFVGLNEKIEARLTNQAINSFDILLPNAALSTILDSTTECLEAAGFHPTDAIEYRRFILHRLLSRIVGETSKLAWKKIMPMLAEKHGFELMDEDRYKALLTKTRGFPLDNRRGEQNQRKRRRRR